MFSKCINVFLTQNVTKIRRLSSTIPRVIASDTPKNHFRNVSPVKRKTLLQLPPSNFIAFRAMSSEEIKNIDIPEYLKLKDDPKTTIIDVREKSEIAETGIIPGGINIPTADVSTALQQDPDKFEKIYNKTKPSSEDRIIFSCRSGKRSLAAAQVARKLGFENVLNLAGGWLAYEEYLKK